MSCRVPTLGYPCLSVRGEPLEPCPPRSCAESVHTHRMSTIRCLCDLVILGNSQYDGISGSKLIQSSGYKYRQHGGPIIKTSLAPPLPNRSASQRAARRGLEPAGQPAPGRRKGPFWAPTLAFRSMNRSGTRRARSEALKMNTRFLGGGVCRLSQIPPTHKEPPVEV